MSYNRTRYLFRRISNYTWHRYEWLEHRDGESSPNETTKPCELQNGKNTRRQYNNTSIHRSVGSTGRSKIVYRRIRVLNPMRDRVNEKKNGIPYNEVIGGWNFR